MNTHRTVPTQFIEAAGIRFAYRRLANPRFGESPDIPLLFFMHFTGTMDHWDPALTDGFAQDRDVILFNNAGVSRARKENRDPLPNEKVAPAQVAALQKWGAPAKDPYAYLKRIVQPTPLVNSSNDVIIYTVNSYILQQHLPNAQLILYPDSNHGSQYQYPELFVEHVTQVPEGLNKKSWLHI